MFSQPYDSKRTIIIVHGMLTSFNFGRRSCAKYWMHAQRQTYDARNHFLLYFISPKRDGVNIKQKWKMERFREVLIFLLNTLDAIRRLKIWGKTSNNPSQPLRHYTPQF